MMSTLEEETSGSIKILPPNESHSSVGQKVEGKVSEHTRDSGHNLHSLHSLSRLLELPISSTTQPLGILGLWGMEVSSTTHPPSIPEHYDPRQL